MMDAAEILRLSERTLVAPLDPLARRIVAASAKRVSVVTAVSPGALIDMLFVAGENLRMLRRPIQCAVRVGNTNVLYYAESVVRLVDRLHPQSGNREPLQLHAVPAECRRTA